MRKKPPPRVIPATNEIVQFFHCKRCLEEVMEIIRRTGQSQSPATYQRLCVGFTPIGLQVWCRRHELNIVHIDFEGQQHPANTERVVDNPPQICG